MCFSLSLVVWNHRRLRDPLDWLSICFAPLQSWLAVIFRSRQNQLCMAHHANSKELPWEDRNTNNFHPPRSYRQIPIMVLLKIIIRKSPSPIPIPAPLPPRCVELLMMEGWLWTSEPSAYTSIMLGLQPQPRIMPCSDKTQSIVHVSNQP